MKEKTIGRKNIMKKSKAKIKKVIKGLKKASKLHAGQAKTLKKILKDQKKGYSKSAKKTKRSKGRNR